MLEADRRPEPYQVIGVGLVAEIAVNAESGRWIVDTCEALGMGLEVSEGFHDWLGEANRWIRRQEEASERD